MKYISSIFLLILPVLLIASISVHNSTAGEINGTEIELPPPSSSFSSHGGKSDKQTIQSLSDPLIINKISNPEESSGLSDGPICVSIEIKNNKINGIDSEINDLYIREIVDDDLRVIDSSFVCYKLDSLNKICNCKAELYRNERSNISDIGTEDGIVYYIKSIDYPIFNWDNIGAGNSTEDNMKLRMFLEDHFDIKWTDVSINKLEDVANNKSIIYINNSLDSDENGDSIEMSIDGNECMNKSILKIDKNRIYEFKVKTENGTRIIYDWMTILCIHINELSYKDSFIYWYHINPKKSGMFNTETIVRIYDEDYRKWPDIDILYPIEIDEQSSDFEVNPKYDKYQIYENEILDVMYDITYRGIGPRFRCDDVLIELDKPNKYYYYVDEFGVRNDDYKSAFENYSSFIMDKTVPIPIRIKYTRSGSYNLPGIWINGNHERLDNRVVTVDPETSKWLYLLPIISIFFTFIILISTFIELFLVHRELKSAQEQFQNLIILLKKIEKKLK